MHALTKDGWNIDSEQVAYIGLERQVAIDFQISRVNNGIVLVEVKGFQSSMVEAFANAIGKMLIYKYILQELEKDIPIWLAVPEAAYQTILTEIWANLCAPNSLLIS